MNTGKFNDKGNMLALKMVTLFGNLIFYAPVALLVRTRVGISYSEFFLLQAIVSVGATVFEVPSGFLSDRLGYKKTLVLSNFCVLTARILILTADRFSIFAAEALLEGTAIALNSGTVSGYIYSRGKEEEFLKNKALIGNYSNMGFFISTLGFALLNGMFGMNALLLATVLSSLTAAVFSLKLEESVGKKRADEEKCPQAAKRTFRVSSTDLMITVSQGLVSLGFILINFFYVSILLEQGIHENYMTPVILIYTAVQMLIPCVMRLGKKRSVIFRMRTALSISVILALGIAFLKNRLIFFPVLLLPAALEGFEIYLDKYRNAYIDERGMQQNRVMMLSSYSMLANFIEILFLTASSQIGRLGVHTLFLALGVAFVMLLLILRRKENVRTAGAGETVR